MADCITGCIGNVISGLLLILTAFGLYWVNHIIKRKDKKEEAERSARESRERNERFSKDMKARKEQLEKEERDKIADIINNEYNDIVEKGIDENLKKCKAKFQEDIMFHGNESEITGLDVLRFMLLNSSDFGSKPLRKLQQDLDTVVRLFRTLRIKLPLKGVCPINIKEELGPLITDVGEVARSFVSANKRYTIANVLRYFGSDCQVKSKNKEEKEDVYHSGKITRFFPYINALCFGESGVIESALVSAPYDQNFSFDISNALRNPKRNDNTSNLEAIEFELCKKERTIEDLRRFFNKIDAIWKQNFGHQLPIPDWSNKEHFRANILHQVRVFMFKIAEGIDIKHDEEFKNLVGEMRNNITYVQESDVRRIDRALRDIPQLVNGLESPQLIQFIVNKLEPLVEHIRQQTPLYRPHTTNKKKGKKLIETTV